MQEIWKQKNVFSISNVLVCVWYKYKPKSLKRLETFNVSSGIRLIQVYTHFFAYSPHPVMWHVCLFDILQSASFYKSRVFKNIHRTPNDCQESAICISKQMISINGIHYKQQSVTFQKICNRLLIREVNDVNKK